MENTTRRFVLRIEKLRHASLTVCGAHAATFDAVFEKVAWGTQNVSLLVCIGPQD
jgi:hypothetical protein